MVLEEFGPVWGLKVDVAAADRENRVHETFVPGCDLEDNVLESVLCLAFNRQNITKVVEIVFPKHFILYRFNPVEDRLYCYAGEALSS